MQQERHAAACVSLQAYLAKSLKLYGRALRRDVVVLLLLSLTSS